MNCDVIGCVALDEILGLFFGSVVDVAFDFHIGNDFLHENAANSACFRVPSNMIAAFEPLGHLSVATSRRRIPPSNGQEESAVNDAFNIVRNIVF